MKKVCSGSFSDTSDPIEHDRLCGLCGYAAIETNLTLSRLAGPDPARADRFVPGHKRTRNPIGWTIVKKRMRTFKEAPVAMHSHMRFP